MKKETLAQVFSCELVVCNRLVWPSHKKKILREKFRPKKFLYFHIFFTVKSLKFCLIFVLIFTHFNSIFYPIFYPISYIPLILIKSLPNFYSYIPHIFYHPSHLKITSIKILSIFKKTLIWSAKMAKIAKKATIYITTKFPSYHLSSFLSKIAPLQKDLLIIHPNTFFNKDSRNPYKLFY